MGLFEGYGQALVDMRRARRLTQSEVVHRAGLAVSHISRVENERADLTLGTLDKLLTAMGATPADFIRALYKLQDKDLGDLPGSSTASSARPGDLAAGDRPRVFLMVEMPPEARPESEPSRDPVPRKSAEILGEVERAIEKLYPAPGVEEEEDSADAKQNPGRS